MVVKGDYKRIKCDAPGEPLRLTNAQGKLIIFRPSTLMSEVRNVSHAIVVSR
jgi:hypothetical protein